MTDSSAGRAHNAFTGITNIFEGAFKIIGLVIARCGGCVMLAIAWFLVIVQLREYEQLNFGPAGWAVAGVFLAAGTSAFVIGLIVTVTNMPDDEDWRVWSVITSIGAGIAFALIVFGYVIQGFSIQVPDNVVYYSVQSGQVYYPGVKVKRNLLSPNLSEIDLAHQDTITVDTATTTSSQSIVTTHTTYVVYEEKQQGKPFESQVRWLVQHRDPRDVNKLLAVDEQAEMVVVEKTLQQMDPKKVHVGMSFKSDEDWISPIQVLSITQKVDDAFVLAQPVQ